MALARALSRPFWTCRSCRSCHLRPFTATTINKVPRRRQRRWNDLVPYQPDELEAHPTFAPVAENGNEMPAFEDEVSDRKAGFDSLATDKDATPKGRKPFRSDGISNLSNKARAQGLSIPAEFVGEEVEAVETFDSLQFEAREQRISRSAPPVKEEPAEKPMSELPWYLQPQHQTPIATDQDSPMAKRQQIPDLPIHPPQNLEAILNHLSVEIGLDYLSILDLRRLDPPPALGNNLIMVVGTARGEKHLNVAAERFCAWLRREYKSYPYADGLLGRNELKIKQKRKAKKARALANAGARANSLEELDDGISTGWICVHAGYLHPHPEAPLKEVKRINGMIGFGEENNKVTLVVQLFTEEKRGTVDIENLWEGILARNLKRQEQQLKDTQAVADVDGEVAKATEEEDESRLTAQELKARKKFKLGSATVLDAVQDWEPQDSARPAVAQVI